VLGRKSSASLRKTPTNINVKSAPKKKHPEKKKVLKIAQSTIFLAVFGDENFDNVYDDFKINRPHTKI